MNKTYKVILVIVLLSIVILVTGASYAYFKATISGDSETISIKAGKMGLTFDDGTSLVSLPNARPGDYITKDFNVENKSTVNSTYDYVYKYNIKLVDVNVTFQEEDLVYKLEEYTDGTYEELKPGGVKESGFINAETITEDNEMYIAARITRPEKGEKHYFRLTITFKNLEDVDQNYNQGATFSAKINIDDNKDPAFGSSDLELAIYLDGDELDTLPEKGTAYYNGIECDNEEYVIANWDYNRWRLNIDTSLPNKCSVNFTSSNPLIAEKIKSISDTTESIIIDDETVQHNLRYVGADADVNNYIWFNCDSYEGITKETAESEKGCEKWRIIGLMNNMTIVDEEGNKTPNQSLVKIIRADSVGNMCWDTSGSYGSNNWNRPATLQTNLISYYNGSTLNSKKGITESTKRMIEQVTWNLGGQSTYEATAQTFYTAERGTASYNNSYTTTWDGYIGLMYPSDYGYATGGGSTYNRQACLNYNLNSWSGTGYKEDCAGTDWLFNSASQWTLAPYSSYSYYVFFVDSGGRVVHSTAYGWNGVRPSLYLKSNVQIVDGKGTNEEPYVIIQGN